MKYTYLLIDLFSVLFPLLFSFHPRLKFYKKWPALFPAILISGLAFIGWDMYFTKLKVWGFNAVYLTGAVVGNLPLEEVLFFLFIPYACVFTYVGLPQRGFAKNKELIVSTLLIVGSVFLAAVYHRQLYTAATFTVLGLLVFVAHFMLKVSWLSRFYQTYLLLLLPFLLVNGLLTGTGLPAPVVWYNAGEMFNIRIMTIPIEDIFYGMGLILLNLLIYNHILESRYRYLKISKKKQRLNEVTSGELK